MPRRVFPISYFGICYETNTNTKIKMNKISWLSRAINYPTMPCCVQNNLEHLISDQSVFFSLASSNSLQLSLIRQKHKLRSHKKSWRSSTDLYLLGFWIPVVPSCQCVASSEYRFWPFVPNVFVLCSSSENEEFPHRPLLPQLHLHPPGFREGFGRRSTAA